MHVCRLQFQLLRHGTSPKHSFYYKDNNLLDFHLEIIENFQFIDEKIEYVICLIDFTKIHV